MYEAAQAVFSQRKFSLALLFSIVIIVALFVDKIDGPTFVYGMGTILGLYGFMNIGQRWTEGRPPPPPVYTVPPIYPGYPPAPYGRHTDPYNRRREDEAERPTPPDEVER